VSDHGYEHEHSPGPVRYKLVVAYDGTDFVGWQKQEPPDPSGELQDDGSPRRIKLRTVQEVLEHAVRESVREEVLVTGASRTDSGVHALGQVAAFTSVPDPDKGVGWPSDRGTDTLVRAINAKLPRDVLVRSAEVVPNDFEPIGGAVEKEYTYTIASGSVRPLFGRRYVFHTWYELDADAMDDAAKLLIGEHDFASFAPINHGRKTTVRTITGCSVERVDGGSGGCDAGGEGCETLRIRVSGNGFLYNMVRILSGTLMEVGRGKIAPGAIPGIIAAADRTANGGPTLPPQGLRLEWIRY
jgi:tRNA pseudouridine38-40 synthase